MKCNKIKCNKIKSKIDFKINNFIKAYKYIDSDLLTNKHSTNHLYSVLN